MQNSRAFDIVLFGATGFTGELTAQYLARSGGEKLRWALAGRSREKLAGVQARLAELGGSRPQLLVADVNDVGSLREMVRSTRVLITTVGPYIKYGEPLVAACAELGTDYVDLTGEPPFVARTQARYHDTAVKNGVKIVHACGFDSIPHDLGALFTLDALHRQMTPAEIESTPVTIEGFVRMVGSVSGGTWQSMLLIMSELKRTATPPPTAAPARNVAIVKPRIAFREEVGLWAVPLPTIDPDVVLHSARLLPQYGPDFHYGHYLGLKRLPQVAGFIVGAGALLGLARVRFTRELLAKFKSSGAGPSEAQRAKSFFRVVFLGKAGAHRVRCQVRGGDPGYGETAKMLAESALCLAFDRARLPAHFGVIPSAAALGEVLTQRLQRAGIVFEELPT